jgi:hypothetical protein
MKRIDQAVELFLSATALRREPESTLLLSPGLAEDVTAFLRLVRRAQWKRGELFRTVGSERERRLTEKKAQSKRRGVGPTRRMAERGRSTTDETMKVEWEKAMLGGTVA